MDKKHANAACPRCGSALPAYAPEGLCPRCLGALNLESDTGPAGFSRPVSSQPPPTPDELAPHFPQLEIIELLGRGGMGVVYRARQKLLDRVVALKLMAPERVSDPVFAERFAREARALAALSHPNIVTVFDFGQAGGYYYLLMEFVDGVNLRQAMRAGRFTAEQALAVVPPICDALQYAHEHGIVHRDIKPENLLLDKEGRAKIADFGIARMLHVSGVGSGDSADQADTRPAESQAGGTPQYMAPEQQAASRQADHRADIYSLGVVLYEMLTGQLPARDLEPPSRKVQIDVRLDAIVMRALERNPELRYQTAGEFRTEIETVTRADALADVVSQNISGHLKARPRLRHWAQGMAGTVFLLVLVMLGITLWRYRQIQVREAMAIRLATEVERNKEAVASTAQVETAGDLANSTVTWTAGPVREFQLSPTKNGANCFASLVRGETFTPPVDIVALTQRPYWWQQLQAPVDRWLRANDIDLFCSEESTSGLELVHGYYGFAARVTLGSNICASLDALEGPRVRRHIEEFVDDALIYQLRIRPQNRATFSVSVPHPGAGQGGRTDCYCFFRTGSGRYGVLQTRESGASLGALLVRYRLFQAQTNGPVHEADPFAVRPDLRFVAWQDQWRKKGSSAARRPDATSLTEKSDRRYLSAVHPVGIEFHPQADSAENPFFLHLWFSHPLFDALSLVEVSMRQRDSRPLVPGAIGSTASSYRPASPQNGNSGWITYTMSPGSEGHLPNRVNVRLRYTFGPPELPRKVPMDFSGAMALEDDGQLNGIGQDSSGRAFLALAGLRRSAQKRQFYARALTKDGRRLACAGKSISGGVNEDSVVVEQLLFDSPLNDIAYFMLGTREVETMEWTDVALPPR